jgi:glycosyltransferase involved in cell wall biosynthesis
VRVCIDIQAAVAQRAGVGRYVKSLVEHLGGHRGTDEIRLFHFDFQRRGVPFEAAGTVARAVRWIPGRVVQQAWKRVGFPPFDAFAGAADVFHFPNFIRPPLARGRSVVTIHDLSFLRFPHAAEAGNLRYLTARIDDTVARADAILADSETIADEIRGRWPAAAARVHGIPLGLPDGFGRPPEDAIRAGRARHGLARPYLLSVGTLEPRKNFPFLVEAFERLRGFDGDLVIAGMKGWSYEPILQRIARSPLAARIRHLEYPADADLPALYAGAAAFVFPSLYEGFGFTPLEAMACGAPVIASAGGSLPEVCGDGAEIVPEYDAGAWADRIAAVLGDPARRAALTARGAANAARFTWDATARKTWDVYRQVGGGA